MKNKKKKKNKIVKATIHTTINPNSGETIKHYRYEKTYTKINDLNPINKDNHIYCDICGEFFKDYHKFKIHRNLHQDKPFICAIKDCAKVFVNHRSYIYHISSIHSQALKYCGFNNCQQQFETIEQYQQHYKDTHKLQYYPCDYPNCKFIYAREKNLLLHKKLHENSSIILSLKTKEEKAKELQMKKKIKKKKK